MLNSLYFRYDKGEKAYIYEQNLKSAPGHVFCFYIYSDGEWFIRVYDGYGNTSHYQDVLRDLVDSSPTEYRQAMRIRREVEQIMTWLTVQRVITGHVIEKTIYITDDGQEFEDEFEAKAHEASSFIDSIQVKFMRKNGTRANYEDINETDIIMIYEVSEDDLDNLAHFLSHDIGYDLRDELKPHTVIYWDEDNEEWTTWDEESESRLQLFKTLKSLDKEVKAHNGRT